VLGSAHLEPRDAHTVLRTRSEAGDGRRPGLIARARSGERKALAALQASARYLGLGLGGIVNIIDPDCVFIGGEITTAWDLVENTVRTTLAERALTRAASSTDIVIVAAEEHPRLRGAAMLVAAPRFAAPVVA
jgi:predicted NBD/HSP70 family sugar kinase